MIIRIDEFMSNRSNSVLNDDKVGRLMLKLSAPAFLGILITVTYSIVNAIFIGRYAGVYAIAGISIVFPVQMLSAGIGQLFGTGGSSVISRSIGAGITERAEIALGNSITLITIFSFIILVAGLSNSDYWLKMLGASETILPYAKDYLRIILIGLFFQTLALSMNSLVTSEGNSRIGMTGMAIGAISNIILDAIFIIVLGMGVRGAAIGTVLAQFLSVFYFMHFYLRGHSYLKIYSKNLFLNWNVIKDMLAIGISSFMTMTASGLSMLFLNKALIVYGGDIAVSAYGIVNRLMIFTMMPGMSIGQGSQPILGFNYGFKRYDRILKTVKIAFTSSILISLTVFFIFYFGSEFFIQIFTIDRELLLMGSYTAKHVFLAVCFTNCILVSIFVFQSFGKAKETFIIMLRPILFLLPLVLILPRYFQLEGVLYTFPLTEVFAFMVAMSLLIPEVMRLKKMRSLNPGIGNEVPSVIC